MKNSYKFALGLLVAVLAIGFSAFTNADHSQSTVYRYTGSTPQAWGATVNQNLSNYTAVTGSYNCVPSTNICTYTIDENDVVSRNAQGTFQQP